MISYRTRDNPTDRTVSKIPEASYLSQFQWKSQGESKRVLVVNPVETLAEPKPSGSRGRAQGLMVNSEEGS